MTQEDLDELRFLRQHTREAVAQYGELRDQRDEYKRRAEAAEAELKSLGAKSSSPLTFWKSRAETAEAALTRKTTQYESLREALADIREVIEGVFEP